MVYPRNRKDFSFFTNQVWMANNVNTRKLIRENLFYHLYFLRVFIAGYSDFPLTLNHARMCHFQLKLSIGVLSKISHTHSVTHSVYLSSLPIESFPRYCSGFRKLRLLGHKILTSCEVHIHSQNVPHWQLPEQLKRDQHIS